MRIFPRFQSDDRSTLSKESILAGLLLAVKANDKNSPTGMELMHLSSCLAGPCREDYSVSFDELKGLIQTSERLLENIGIEGLIESANEMLSDRQKLATLVTIMDVCLVENSQLDGEKGVFGRIRQGFGISEDELRPFEEMLILKNEPSIRLSVLPHSYSRAAEGFRALV